MSASKRFWLIGAFAVAVSLGASVRADAQYRRGAVVVVGGGVYAPYPYWGWGGFYDPWWAPYPYPPPFPYRYRDAIADVRLEVKPKEAEVYVDGYYAGIVDDFDGVFQRLHAPPGEHEITLYLDGYRTVRQRLYLSADHTTKVTYTMERLAAGEQPEPRPQPPAGQYQTGAPNAPYPPPPPGQPPVRRGAPRPMPPNAPPPNLPPPGAPGASNADGYGRVAIRVQPPDADVMIDGQPWRGASDRDGLTVEVPEGRHAIEIRKAGYRTYITEIDVRRGETTPLNVSLRGQNEN